MNLSVFCLATVLLHFAQSLPASFDWRQHNAVSPVKNQGELGKSDWLATLGSIESLNFIRRGKLVSLSTAEMEDCCQTIDDAPTCIGKLKGLCSEADYPTAAGACKKSLCTPAITITGFHAPTAGDEKQLQKALLKNPVVAYIDASRPSFQLYRGGVYDDEKCSSSMLDHAILIIGYGMMQGKPYWICQNSWGKSWGMNGYVLIARGSNRCGIASQTYYPYV
ncbi:cysteine proteinase 3-like [Watersipora subatra]|uniref:cysteine proteinase 3-like n=1 Tax=Watersipora subatra TaxID=2589382 RepID=UPI00355B1891